MSDTLVGDGADSDSRRNSLPLLAHTLSNPSGIPEEYPSEDACFADAASDPPKMRMHASNAISFPSSHTPPSATMKTAALTPLSSGSVVTGNSVPLQDALDAFVPAADLL